MIPSIERAVLSAAEATLGHLIMITRMNGSKLISEGVLYETFHSTLRTHTKMWVNHEHKVHLASEKIRKSAAGDKKRVDFAIKHDNNITLVEVKIASRTKLAPQEVVTDDMQKLATSTPMPSSGETFANVAYLVVFNLSIGINEQDPKSGIIEWANRPPHENDVDVIGTYQYDSVKLKRSAVVFRIRRRNVSSK